MASSGPGVPSNGIPRVRARGLSAGESRQTVRHNRPARPAPVPARPLPASLRPRLTPETGADFIGQAACSDGAGIGQRRSSGCLTRGQTRRTGHRRRRFQRQHDVHAQAGAARVEFDASAVVEHDALRDGQPPVRAPAPSCCKTAKIRIGQAVRRNPGAVVDDGQLVADRLAARLTGDRRAPGPGRAPFCAVAASMPLTKRCWNACVSAFASPSHGGRSPRPPGT